MVTVTVTVTVTTKSTKLIFDCFLGDGLMRTEIRVKEGGYEWLRNLAPSVKKS